MIVKEKRGVSLAVNILLRHGNEFGEAGFPFEQES